MASSLIQRMYQDFKSKGRYTVPKELLPPEKGYHIRSWVQELLLYYKEAGVITRTLADLPQIKLSNQSGLNITLQDIHKFIIGEQNLIPFETKKRIVENSIGYSSSNNAWQEVRSILVALLKDLGRDSVQEELSWKFSPVGQALWVITWFFMEREDIKPPADTCMICHRFPYYLWQNTDVKDNFLKQSLWEPDNPYCRWEWLAADLFYNWLKIHNFVC